MGNNEKSINIQAFIDDACKKYGLDPNGLVACAYKQGVVDLTIEVQRRIKAEEDTPYKEVKE